MIRAKEVYKHFRSDRRQCLVDLQEALRRGLEGQPGGVRPEEFSIRDLAAYFVTVDGEPIGHELVSDWAAGRLLEADGVSSTAFAAITQRIFYTAVLEGYRYPDTPLSRLVRTVQVRSRDTRVPNLTLPLVDGKSLEYEEAQDKPALGLMTEYVRALPPRKRGGRIPITRETVVFDETNQILEAARRIGETIAVAKEALLTRYAIGLVTNCVIERRATDSAEVTSNLFLTTGRWINSHVNPLSDWTDIDDAENLLLGNTLPGTGYPPMLNQRVILAPPQMMTRINRILNATEVRTETSASTTSGSNTTGSASVVASANPLAGRGIQAVISTHVWSEQRAAGVAEATAASRWFYGDLLQAMRYLEVWPLELTESRDEAVLRRADIVVEFNVSEMGVPVIVEPRVWSRNDPS